jgi:Fur family transcriptional regulator, peroxide stress response regulator
MMDTNKRDVFLRTLQQAGRRITEQRRAICDYLAATDRHPTPYEIYADLSTNHPEISRATIYNTLNVLQELGAIVEISVGAGHAHYDTETAPHVNLVCLRCHQIEDHPNHDPTALAPMEALRTRAIGLQGFQPVAVRVDVYGFCAACRARKKAEIRETWLKQKRNIQEERSV